MRELSNLIERMAILYPNGVVGVSELPSKFQNVPEPNPELYEQAENAVSVEGVGIPHTLELDKLPDEGIDLKKHLETIEQRLLEQALAVNDNVVARAAETLNIRRTTLVEKMRKYGMQRK